MHRLQSFVFFVLSLFILQSTFGQEDRRDITHLLQDPLTYIVYRSTDSILIDGKPNDKAWLNAHWTAKFQDIEGDIKPAPAWDTYVKMLWDDTYLYILAKLEEPDIWGTLLKHDQVVYYDNDFEVFIDPDGDTHNYYEIEINALNTIFDLFLPKPYRNFGRAQIRWNLSGLRSVVYVDGTLNDPSDIDKEWFIEMAIPFKSLDTANNGKKPVPGELWNINFSRVQWQIDKTDKEYTKKKVGGKTLPEKNWVWSPQGVINMHYPERWGYVKFSGEKSGALASFPVPDFHALKKKLWEVYYRQKEYFSNRKQYSVSLTALGISEKYNHDIYGQGLLRVQATSQSFIASLELQSGETWLIDQDGKIIKKSRP